MRTSYGRSAREPGWPSRTAFTRALVRIQPRVSLPGVSTRGETTDVTLPAAGGDDGLGGEAGREVFRARPLPRARLSLLSGRARFLPATSAVVAASGTADSFVGENIGLRAKSLSSRAEAYSRAKRPYRGGEEIFTIWAYNCRKKSHFELKTAEVRDPSTLLKIAEVARSPKCY